MASAASTNAAVTANNASHHTWLRLPAGIAVSIIARKTNGGTKATTADAMMAAKKMAMVVA